MVEKYFCESLKELMEVELDAVWQGLPYTVSDVTRVAQEGIYEGIRQFAGYMVTVGALLAEVV